MPILKNFARGGGRRMASAGGGRGGIVAALRFAANDLPEASAVEALSVMTVSSPRICCTPMRRAPASGRMRKGLRKDDGSFDGLLLLEGLDEAALRAALATTGFDTAAPLYRMIFALQGRPGLQA
jgi:hypothetical protein